VFLPSRRVIARYVSAVMMTACGATACSAVLGIEAIPSAGEFPIDSSASCAELRMSSPEKVCGSDCRHWRLECDEAKKVRTCICEDEGGVSDGATFPDGGSFSEASAEVGSFDGGAPEGCTSGMTCGQESGPMESGAHDSPPPADTGPADMTTPPTDSPTEPGDVSTPVD
jgi:hypothetical protein